MNSYIYQKEKYLRKVVMQITQTGCSYLNFWLRWSPAYKRLNVYTQDVVSA